MSISKITNSFLSGTNENNLSLANVNFDFALLKVSPPPEYKGLGLLLSSRRREAAEEGELHKTARRLSALFQPLLPKTPALIKAYGNRVSEISEIMNTSRKDGSRLSAMFSEWVGIDATSIWAGATSGPAAISVHLLACMIARSFKVSEAISIWYELVEIRKEQIKQNESQGLADVFEIFAGRSTIAREDLAEWDASARAWLRSADQAMSEKQTRLMRALEGLNLPIESQSTLLDSVMNACNRALEAMERLICGTALCIQSPAVLCGLSCWHIYPDVLVLGTGNNEPIRQHDPLVATGGLLTVGMKFEACQDQVIFWSLPLSFLRWYGDPVVVHGAIGPSQSRFNSREFIFITLGCLFDLWAAITSDDEVAALWIALVFELFKNSISWSSKPCRATNSRSWLYLLNQAAQTFLQSQGEEKLEYKRMISFGRRNSVFLRSPPPPLPPPLPPPPRIRIGSYEPPSGTGNETPPEAEDEALLSTGYGAPFEAMFGLLSLPTITHLLPSDESRIEFLRRLAVLKNLDPRRHILRYTPTKNHRFQKTNSSEKIAPYEYASIAPVMISTSRKRDREGCEKEISSLANVRWLPEDLAILRQQSTDHAEQYLTAPSETLESARWCVVYAGFGIAILWLPHHHILDNAGFAKSNMGDKLPSNSVRISLEEMTTLLRGCTLDCNKMTHHFYPSEGSTTWLLGCLRSVSVIHRIYKLLPGATISAKILRRPIGLWGNCGAFYSDTLKCGEALAVVAFCDSGDVTLIPELNVFALSTGDSIFVHGQLLSDPHEEVEEFELRRLYGNIGQPGIVFLANPINPRVRSTDYPDWRVVNHFAFEGTCSDSFRNTSLHLSFTNWKLPLDHHSGSRDPEIFVMESVISILDNGRWVADVDINRALEQCYRWNKACNGISTSCCSKEDGATKRRLEFKTVDCWEELLEPPNGHMIARARDNWIARLALTSLAVRLAFTVVILPRDGCPSCLENLVFEEYPSHDEFGNSSNLLVVIM